MRLRSGAMRTFGERATAGALERYFASKPYRVFKDTSLRQVIEVDSSELRAGEWRYYTTAAFDFLICNRDEDTSYEMVVEFDGPAHKGKLQGLKDSLKNRLCISTGLPIMRIGSEEVLVHENMTFLQYMLDLYFGEKEMNRLKSLGRISHEGEFFIGYGFPGTDQIERRLITERGLAPAALVAFMSKTHSAERIPWYRVLDQGANTTRIELMEGWTSPRVLRVIERTANVTLVNPEMNVPGIHLWHLASELARFLCFEALEKDLGRLAA